jgi:aryl-alcohol dehydrogenase-like predicted oxidoreductase
MIKDIIVDIQQPVKGSTVRILSRRAIQIGLTSHPLGKTVPCASASTVQQGERVPGILNRRETEIHRRRERYSLTKLAVAWVAANPVITAPIIGASRADQLTDTLAAIELTLDPALKAKLDKAMAESRRGNAAR